MIYRPVGNTRLWDVWLFPSPECYHMFYLESPVGKKRLDHIGHAVSDDLIHWQQRASVPTLGPRGAWDEEYALTGTTVEHEGQYYMFYGADGVPQRIGVMLSDDLEHWEKYAQNPVLEPAGRYYQAALSENLPLWYVDWRDPCIVLDPAARHYEALICARTSSLSPGLGTCIARAASKDLLHWELLRPAVLLGGFVQAELPDYFELNGHHYLLFTSVDGRGAAHSTRGREWASGVFYVHSDERHGDYRLPPDPLLFGAGHGRHEAYAGRTMPFEGGRLFYHQIRTQPARASRFVFGVKLLHQLDDGALQLRYWPGHRGLEVDGTKVLGFQGLGLRGGEDIGVGKWRLEEHTLVGQSKLVGSAVLRPESRSDFHISCRVAVRDAGRAGILFRYRPETRQGVVVVVDFERGLVEIGGARRGWRWIGRTVWDRTTCDLLPGEPANLRILCRSEFAEVYLDDRWVFSTALQETPAESALHEVPGEGALGFFVEDGEASFSDVRLVPLEPLP